MREVSGDETFRAQKRAFLDLDLKNDRICRDQLHFDTHCFEKLCNLLKINGRLKTTRYVTVKEIIAMFIHILAHDLKNRVVQGIFARLGETVSR